MTSFSSKYFLLFAFAAIFLAGAASASEEANPFAPKKRGPLDAEKSEELCERYGDTLERKFASNPKVLAQELDELVVKSAMFRPDRVNTGGRMLASLSTANVSRPPQNKFPKTSGEMKVRIHNKITEANIVLKQMKRLGFFEEDEERQEGVQEACARVIYERAKALDFLTR